PNRGDQVSGRFRTATTSSVLPALFVSKTDTSSQPSAPSSFSRSVNAWPFRSPDSQNPAVENITDMYSHFMGSPLAPPQPRPISLSNSSSLSTGTPSSRALSSLLPASSPATT